jgi:hypothetical protein
MPDYTIRPYQKGDETSINKSFNEVFGTARSIDEWFWKFRPDLGISRIMIAVDEDNTVLAHYASTESLMWIDGRVIACAQNLDSFSLNRTDLLKRRVFLKTAYEFIDKNCYGPDKIPFYYGCIGGRHLKLGKITFKYTEPVPIKYYYKETMKFLRPLGILIGKYLWKAILSRYNSIELTEVDDLWERSKNRYGVSIVRNSKYIDERYLSHPIKKYMFLTVKNNSQLSALAVLIYEDRLLKWVDLIWDGDNDDAIKELESEIWSICKKVGAIKVEIWLNNDKEVEELLLQAGMKTCPNPYDLYLSSRSFDEDLDGDDVIRRFYFTMGNTDMV